MFNQFLTPIERASVKELCGNTRDKEAYLKLSVLVMLDKGKSYEEISVLLGLNHGSILTPIIDHFQIPANTSLLIRRI